MKMLQVWLPVFVIFVFFPASSLAQVNPIYIHRVVYAEAAYIDEIEGVIDRVSEEVIVNELGFSETRVEVFRGSSSSYASQNTVAIADEDSLSVYGSLVVGEVQPEEGVLRYFFSSSSVNGLFTVESPCGYRIQGTRSYMGGARLYFVNWDTQDQVSISLDWGEFEYSGKLVAPGYYQFQVILYSLNGSDSILLNEGVMDFRFEVFEDPSVAAEPCSWGRVKSLFR